MPDDQKRAASAAAGPEDDERNEAGAREQGVLTEDSEDLSSPRLTVREDTSDDGDRG
jgi:hypothetical protein